MNLTKTVKAARKRARMLRGWRQNHGTAAARKGRGRRAEAHNGGGWGELKTKRRLLRQGAFD